MIAVVAAISAAILRDVYGVDAAVEITASGHWYMDARGVIPDLR